MKNQLLVAEFLATPWALMPERLSALVTVISRWTQGAPASDAAMFQVQTDRVLRDTRRQTSAAISGGGIAVIPIYGVITQRGNMVDDVSGPGMVSTQIVTQMLRQAVADDAVSQILLDIDSPGGSVYGVSELGDAILSARAQKPVVAIANSLAASAAYWVGSQASEFYVTAGGEVGSIGVWQAHQDYSKAMDEAGVKTTLISAGKFKVEGNPYAPLDEEAQGFMQSRVDDYYAAFTKAVAKGRGVPITQVRDGMGQGRVLGADAALAQNMVDGIASFDQVLSKMHKDAASSAKSSPPAKPKTSRLAQARSELGIL
ncbi:S49 family peptidase [Limnohabitans sp. 15K]|jgi:capsid assembly protease|uniref:S49 family peptidase n=1 Tax=Limnohabitans sp. 15K TaxID=1100706 RepID=UPI000C1E3758|nr:S49 family peptidase [Limnohabitans sp. 15K]PIT80169.1 peptidase S49 [Limnohabitans sp. 15K]